MRAAWVAMVALAIVLATGAGVGLAADASRLSGKVTDPRGKALSAALVTLQCSCLQEARGVQTDGSGEYRFDDLPAGTYTMMVAAGAADTSKVVPLPAGARLRVDFSVDPN